MQTFWWGWDEISFMYDFFLGEGKTVAVHLQIVATERADEWIDDTSVHDEKHSATPKTVRYIARGAQNWDFQH